MSKVMPEIFPDLEHVVTNWAPSAVGAYTVHSPSRSAVLQVLERVLREGLLDALRGWLVVADEIQTRIRWRTEKRDV